MRGINCFLSTHAHPAVTCLFVFRKRNPIPYIPLSFSVMLLPDCSKGFVFLSLYSYFVPSLLILLFTFYVFIRSFLFFYFFSCYSCSFYGLPPFLFLVIFHLFFFFYSLFAHAVVIAIHFHSVSIIFLLFISLSNPNMCRTSEL